jgi:hypothetical protein
MHMRIVVHVLRLLGRRQRRDVLESHSRKRIDDLACGRG